MLDCHFSLGLARFAIAADADLLVAFSQLLAGVGAETVAAVAPANAPALRLVRCDGSRSATWRTWRPARATGRPRS